MSFEFRPRPASVLASMLAAGLMLTVASCGHLTPLGPDAAATAPQPSHLRSPIVLRAMSVQPPTPAGARPVSPCSPCRATPASAPARSVRR